MGDVLKISDELLNLIARDIQDNPDRWQPYHSELWFSSGSSIVRAMDEPKINSYENSSKIIRINWQTHPKKFTIAHHKNARDCWCQWGDRMELTSSQVRRFLKTYEWWMDGFNRHRQWNKKKKNENYISELMSWFTNRSPLAALEWKGDGE